MMDRFSKKRFPIVKEFGGNEWAVNHAGHKVAFASDMLYFD
jgi:hypothetical protein